MTDNKHPLSFHLYWLIPAVSTLALYLTTYCRTVYIGDSGEFSLVFKTLGIAHTPGYPLFTLLGRLFLILFTFLKPALAANLLGIIIAAAVIPLIFILLKDDENPLLASTLALLWGLTPSYWSQTAGIEVYLLNLLFIALASMLALSDLPKKWYLTAYLAGLAFAHHYSFAVIVPPLIVIFLLEKRNLKRIPLFILLFVLGLSVFIYLPVRASLHPIANWGDPSNWERFFNHVTSRQYHFAASFTLDNITVGMQVLADTVLSDWWYIGVILAAAGIYIGIKHYLKRTALALGSLLVTIFIISYYQIPDIDSYLLPASFGIFLLMGNTVQWLYGMKDKKRIYASIPAVIIALAFIIGIINYKQVNYSGYTITEDYGRLILDTAGEGTVFTGDDISSFPALYLRYGEGYNPHAEVFDKALRLRALYDEAYKMTGIPAGDYLSSRNAYMGKAPGIVHLMKSHHIYSSEWYESTVDLYSNWVLYSSPPPEGNNEIPNFSTVKAHISDFKTRQLLCNVELCRGEEYMRASPPDSRKAIESFRKAFAIYKDEPRGVLHNHLGIFFRNYKFEELALEAYDNALKSPRLYSSERRDVIFNISNIYKDRGNRKIDEKDYNAAVEAFAKALEYDLDNTKLIYNTGILYTVYLSQPQKGIPFLRRYLTYNPNDDQVKRIIEEHQSR